MGNIGQGIGIQAFIHKNDEKWNFFRLRKIERDLLLFKLFWCRFGIQIKHVIEIDKLLLWPRYYLTYILHIRYHEPKRLAVFAVKWLLCSRSEFFSYFKKVNYVQLYWAHLKVTCLPYETIFLLPTDFSNRYRSR